jgi:hypothetical protein
MLIDSERESCATFPFAYILLELSLLQKSSCFPALSLAPLYDQAKFKIGGRV